MDGRRCFFVYSGDVWNFLSRPGGGMDVFGHESGGGVEAPEVQGKLAVPDSISRRSDAFERDTVHVVIPNPEMRDLENHPASATHILHRGAIPHNTSAQKQRRCAENCRVPIKHALHPENSSHDEDDNI